jgi:hypothetical protein
VNLETGVARPIALDTDVWKRLGYEAPELAKKKKAAEPAIA